MGDFRKKILQSVISEREEQELRRLWREAFEEEEAYLEYYHRNFLRKNRIWTLWDGDVLASMIHVNPYQIWQDNRILPGAFLVGVATDERYRRQGCMRILMEDVLDTLRSEGLVFAYLLPAKEEYYLPFGFATVGTQHSWTKKKNGEQDPFSGLSMFGRTETWSCLSNPAGMELVELADFYNQWLKEHYRSFVWRDKAYFSRRQEETQALSGCLYRLQESGRITGVASLAQEESLWRLYDVAGDDLLERLKQSPDWLKEEKPLKIMIKWFKKPDMPEEWLPFAVEELT